MNLELFCCSGGMAAGFRAAGIEFDLAVDFDPNHCDSYERNLGHRPEQLDVRVLLEQVRSGERVLDVDLLVADPPCTPWSRAGKRLGQADERDMLEVTCELIAALRPRRYLIGNVPGLEDGNNLGVVHRTIGALSKLGYCAADFLSLDAANYGVPQHRRRPFWFGHREGPCLRAPAPTHCDPLSLATLPLPGITPLKPWVTCRDALGHLSPEELGRAVKMRRREQNGKQLGSVPDRPARVVGTSNLSDGNVITAATTKHPALTPDAPSTTVTGGGAGHSARPLVLLTRHEAPVHTSNEDEPARSLTTQCRAPGHASTIILNERHAPNTLDKPAHMLMLDGEVARRKRSASTKGPQSTRTITPDAPSSTVQARGDHPGSGSPVLEWPWLRPSTTVSCRAGLAPPGHHDENFAIMSLPDAVILSERAAMILQGFPEGWSIAGATKKVRWGAIGMAIPPALAEAVARAIVKQDAATRDQAELALGAG